MTTTDGAARHLAWLAARQCSCTTIYNRRCALARLARYLGGDPLAATYNDLTSWQAVRATQLVPSSLRAEMSTIRQYYRWCVRESILTADPTLRLDLPREPRRRPRPAADGAIAAAIASAEPDLAAILGLAALAGLRACEVASLDWCQIEYARLWVTGKGGHERCVPVSPDLTALLNTLPRRRGPVIPRLDGTAGHNAAHRISQRAGRHLAPWGVTLHQLRHRYVTVAYRAERDIRAAQDLAGHASVSTTAVYAAPSSAAVAKAAEAAGHLAA